MMNKLLNIVDTDTKKWDYLKEVIPDLKYNIPNGRRILWSVLGHQQRAFVIYWAIKEHERTGGIGLDAGCGQLISPFCIGTDLYAGSCHPQYSGAYHPHVRCPGEVLPFRNGVFDFIVSHHSLEHMKDTGKTLREWLRVLKNGCKIAIVMPDKTYGPFEDRGHVSECTPEEFLEILKRIENIKVIEYNTLKNHFSFNALIEKQREHNGA